MAKVKKIKYALYVEEDGTIQVTDPCYDEDVWCRVELKNALPGWYDATVGYAQDGCISSLTVTHQGGYSNYPLNTPEHSIGVDAALAGFYSHKPNIDKQEDWQKLVDQLYGPGWETRGPVVKVHIHADREKNFGLSGITVNSGYGDGAYPVYVAKNSANQIVRARIRFIW